MTSLSMLMQNLHYLENKPTVETTTVTSLNGHAKTDPDTSPTYQDLHSIKGGVDSKHLYLIQENMSSFVGSVMAYFNSYTPVTADR